MDYRFLNSGQELSFWSPSPRVSRIGIEELIQARHDSTDSAHVLIGPRLLWNEWQRHMHKLAGIILNIATGSGYIWPQEMHETQILAIYFTFINRFPWQLQRTNLLVGMCRHLRGVLKNDHSLGGDIMS